MKAHEYNISSEKFKFVQNNDKIHDKELSTKPVSYLKDAFSRFKKNKGSIVAACIIMVLVLFAIIGPIASPYTVAYNDPYFKLALPKNEIFYNLGINAWDGCFNDEINETNYLYYKAISLENVEGKGPIRQFKGTITKLNFKKQEVRRALRFMLPDFHCMDYNGYMAWCIMELCSMGSFLCGNYDCRYSIRASLSEAQ